MPRSQSLPPVALRWVNRVSSVDRFLPMIAAWAVSCTLVSTATAAETEFVGVLAIAVEDDVAKIVGLDDSQRQQILELVKNRENAVLDLRQELKTLSDEEQKKKLAEFRHYCSFHFLRH